MKTRYIDLHTHSIYSDGDKSVEQLINLAKQNDVHTFAITDHDDVRSFDELKSLAKKEGIRVISGIEMSTYYINPSDSRVYKIHLLGYGIDVKNTDFLQQMQDYRKKRFKDNIEMLSNLLKNNINIPDCIFSEVRFSNYLSILNEIKRVLLKNNYSKDFIKTFIEQVKPFAPKYQNYELEIIKAVDLIIQSGGIPVLAHPHEIKMSFIDKDILVKKLKTHGLKAVEVFCSEANIEETLTNKALAENNNLLVSTGSDYHFQDENNKTIGKGINNNLCKTSCSFVSYLEKEDLFEK